MKRLTVGDRVEYATGQGWPGGTVVRIVLPGDPQVVEISLLRRYGPPLLLTVASSRLVKTP
jgi:hypothetical protein